MENSRFMFESRTIQNSQANTIEINNPENLRKPSESDDEI
jgi:hypothetical protein